MSENVTFAKQVYNKGQYSKIIDTSFKQLGVKTIQQQIEAKPTVEQFFEMYNELFYEIPEDGNNSHTYLIETSSGYINYQQNLDEIIALQAEIAQLRIDLLESQKQVAELQQQIN
jgi:hypothetical protein